MIQASIVTIGDEILIGQILDTNSSHIAQALENEGVKVSRMLSVADNADQIESTLRGLLESQDIVITTGGLGPTKDDITKATLLKLSGSKDYREDPGQLEMVRTILKGRGLDMLPNNRAQALVPDKAEVIVNKLGTAPIMVFRDLFGKGTLYSLPGVPHEATGAIPEIISDIKKHFNLGEIVHSNIMVYGIAESALSELIAPWEDALPKDIHLAYLPNTLTGIRLRLSSYTDGTTDVLSRQKAEIAKLRAILGNKVYALKDSNLEQALGELLLERGKTVSCAESCTGGEIAHMFTTVAGSSAYFLGSVTSYAVSVKEKVLGVNPELIERFGVVSSEVAAAMAEGVRRLTGSDYAVSTTGLSGPSGDGINPVGTVWIGVTGPHGTVTQKYCYHNDRKRNIERFAATALNMLRLYILED
ncbi:MAG: CinA family nicotinamide mononucleotide deamidase-related protein [Bacteroidales bacterium]|nr:CinA family nicotinamide mononucleotide deamidase-related protein [Bacteroidales bacterium]MBP5676683.1 CinA family nicotinamide mononucleotide deamidase-related protein [Bacteroidales bacterium]